MFLNIDVKVGLVVASRGLTQLIPNRQQVDNEPERLFTLMHEIIAEYPDYETLLAPRLVLGLWHPKYIAPATSIIPYIRLTHIGMSPALARKYFWASCSAFSMNFSCLVGADGEAFRQECKAANKDLCEFLSSSDFLGSPS